MLEKNLAMHLLEYTYTCITVAATESQAIQLVSLARTAKYRCALVPTDSLSTVSVFHGY